MSAPKFSGENLRSDLDQLWLLLGEADGNHDKVAALAPPGRLHMLFYLILCRTLKMGPSAEGDPVPNPAAILNAASEAADRGALPLSTVSYLRNLLDEMGHRLVHKEAWLARVPLWWHPLPLPSRLERIFSAFESCIQPGKRPSPGTLAEGALGYALISDFLDKTFLASLSQEMLRAHDGGQIPLEQAGVGFGEKRVDRRSDAVCFLTGMEPWLLASVPHLAGLLQWGLHRLAEWLAPLIGFPLYAPETGMLSRYEAPSGGYAPHRDNPGGAHDNGRALTFTLYLNHPHERVAGGELVLWRPDVLVSKDPDRLVAHMPGRAVIFDSRRIPHQVNPLHVGPARWALTFWFSEKPRRPPDLPLPSLTASDVLLPLSTPALPPDKILVHDVNRSVIRVWTVPSSKPRIGLVCTVYRGGRELEKWCRHHLGLGFDHLILVFDHLEEPAEKNQARRLESAFPEVTVWSGSVLAKRGWPTLATEDKPPDLVALARSGGTSYAVAARQMFNASASLSAAKGNSFGGAPLDWLLHLDADEYFWLEGKGRGGDTLQEHYAAATAAGTALVRYVNHELLVEPNRGEDLHHGRYKLNPHVAREKLGDHGWRNMVTHLRMSQADDRPWFHGYFNGKAAVAVVAARAAAGVHGWQLQDPANPPPFLNGPCVLHRHNRSATEFATKYLNKAATPLPPGNLPFQPSLTETTTLELIARLQAEHVSQREIEQHLRVHHAALTSFSQREIDLLEEAGIFFHPDQ